MVMNKIVMVMHGRALPPTEIIKFEGRFLFFLRGRRTFAERGKAPQSH
jgi:hypothetical protein